MVARAPVVIQPGDKPAIVGLRMRIRAKGDLFGEALLKAWDFELIDLHLELAERALNPAMPVLQNTDGEPLRLMQLPEVRQRFDEMLARHYSGWLDSKLPALGNRTPRESVRDPDGREAVARLIAQIERDGARQSPPLDAGIVAMLRRELGLR